MNNEQLELMVRAIAKAQKHPDYIYHKAVNDTEQAILEGSKDSREIPRPCYYRPNFDIRVSAASRSRALHLLDVLCRLAESLPDVEVKCVTSTKLGYHHPERDYYFSRGEHRFSISIKETTTRKEKPSTSPWREYEFTPTGNLSLEVTRIWMRGTTLWKDTRNQRLEDHLIEIAAVVPQAFEALELQKIEKEEAEQRRKIQEAERALSEKRAACRERNIRATFQAADDHERAQQLSRLLDHADHSVGTDWRDFVQELIAELDPMRNGKKPWERFQQPASIV